MDSVSGVLEGLSYTGPTCVLTPLLSDVALMEAGLSASGVAHDWAGKLILAID